MIHKNQKMSHAHHFSILTALGMVVREQQILNGPRSVSTLPLLRTLYVQKQSRMVTEMSALPEKEQQHRVILMFLKRPEHHLSLSRTGAWKRGHLNSYSLHRPNVKSNKAN